jgi:hypothetical protein
MSIRYRKWRSILDLDLLTDQSEFIETARHACTEFVRLARVDLPIRFFSALSGVLFTWASLRFRDNL